MQAGLLEIEDFADAYSRWVRGDCPCCGFMSADSSWPDERGITDDPNVQARAIGEGVLICGRCVVNEHGREDTEFFPMMLRAIAMGAAAQRLRERPRG